MTSAQKLPAANASTPQGNDSNSIGVLSHDKQPIAPQMNGNKSFGNFTMGNKSI